MLFSLAKDTLHQIFSLLDAHSCVSLARSSHRFLWLLRDFFTPTDRQMKVLAARAEFEYPLICKLLKTQYTEDCRVWFPCFVKFSFAAFGHSEATLVFYARKGSLLHRVSAFSQWLHFPFAFEVRVGDSRPLCVDRWASDGYTLHLYTDREDSISHSTLSRELEDMSTKGDVLDCTMLPYLFARLANRYE